ncbi:hypothetical protein Hdeb2414_s0007g00230971 [Helianthus debilis subsp. tardiflorus]
MFEWPPHDERLLTILADVRDENDVSMGTNTNNAFYKKLAEKLTFDEGIDVSVDDVADRVRHHRDIYHSYKGNAANFHHVHVENLAYSDLLKRCFAVEKKTIRVPRNLGSTRSSSCTSTSSTARTVATILMWAQVWRSGPSCIWRSKIA